jgi:hypothetical protein
MTSRNPAEVGASVSLTSKGIAGEGKRCLKELDDNRVWGGREGEEYRRREEGQQSLEVWSHGDGGRGMLKGTGEPKSVRALGERTFLSSFFHDQQISRILSTRRRKKTLTRTENDYSETIRIFCYTLCLDKTDHINHR